MACALQPYFLSTLETLAWRHAIPETLCPEVLPPGLRIAWGRRREKPGRLPATGWARVDSITAGKMGTLPATESTDARGALHGKILRAAVALV